MTSKIESHPPTSEPGLPQPENKVFYPALDGLRAIAVTIVFLHHYRLKSMPWLEWGWVGVDIFFVLSGFLITGILFDTRHSKNRFSSFYARRTLRIFPLYYALWLVTLLSTPLLHLQWTRRWLLWPFYLGNYTHLLATRSVNPLQADWLFIHAHRAQMILGDFISFGHLWSLSVEEQFYLAWPFIVFAVVQRRRLLAICVSVIVLEPLLRTIVVHLASPDLLIRELLYRSTPLRCDSFLIGGAVALLLRGDEAGKVLRSGWRLFIVAALAFTATYLVAVRGFHSSPGGLPTLPWISTIGFTWVDLMAAGLLIAALRPASFFYRLLRCRPLPQLGRISYGFYVFHDITHSAFESWGVRLVRHFTHTIHPGAGIVFAFFMTTVLALLSFHVLEMPFLRLKRYFQAES